MQNFQINALDVVASYNRIDPAFHMRPTPGDISTLLFELIAQSVHFEAALADLKQNVYAAETAKAAASQTQPDVLAKLSEYANGITLGLDAAVSYRKTSGGSHETVYFLLKGESGGPLEPWGFSLVRNGQTIDGYVCVAIGLGVQTATVKSADGSEIQVKKSAPRTIAAPDRAPSQTSANQPRPIPRR